MMSSHKLSSELSHLEAGSVATIQLLKKKKKKDTFGWQTGD